VRLLYYGFYLLSFTAVCPSAHPAAIDEAAVLAAMEKPGRLSDDIERDQRSKPASIIPLLNLESSDYVVDIFGSGGYYSELLASVVGEDGEVFLHNNAGFEAWGINGLTDRFSNRNPGNIIRHTREGLELDLKEESIDGALIVMAIHDMYVIPKRYNGVEYVQVGEMANAQYLLQQVYFSLKPGGRFVVIDHAGDESSDNETVSELHRIIESFVRKEIEKQGFQFLSSTDSLRNSEDDRSMIVFDLDVQGRTDRFVLTFEKPE
jgi:predicted methyltransferase